MRLDQLVVSELKDKGSFLLIYINEYSVPISAFTFHSEIGAIRGWLEKFREAQVCTNVVSFICCSYMDFYLHNVWLMCSSFWEESFYKLNITKKGRTF